MERDKKALKNIKFGTLLAIVTAIAQFICRTVMLKTIGTGYVGLDGVFLSLIGMYSLTELGISNAINYSLYEPMVKHDTVTANKIIAFYKDIYRLVGIATLCIGFMIIPILKYLIADNISNIREIYILYILSVINSAIGYFLFAYKQSIFVANIRGDEISIIKSFTLIIQCFVQILVLVFFRNYMFYLIVSIFMTLVSNCLCSLRVQCLFPEYYAEGKLDKEQKLNILKNIKGLFIQKVGNTVWNSVDSIVISAFLGLHMVALYNNYYYVMRFVFMLLGAVETALIPAVGNSIITESKEKNQKDFYNINFVYVWLLTLATACYCSGIQVFIKMWVGEKMLFSNGIVILLGIYLYASKMGSIGYVYKEAAGIWTKGQYIPLISAMANLLMNIALTKYIGIAGILISSIISMGTINLLGYLFILFNEYLGKRSDYIKHMLRQYHFGFINLSLVFLVFYVIAKIELQGISGLVISVFLALILLNIGHFIVFHRVDEYNNALQMIRKIINSSGGR